MSYKDGGAKQTQDYRDYFNHFDAPLTIGTSTSRSRFHAGFLGSGKWFRSDSRYSRAASPSRAMGGIVATRSLPEGGLTSGRRRVMQEAARRQCWAGPFMLRR